VQFNMLVFKKMHIKSVVCWKKSWWTRSRGKL